MKFDFKNQAVLVTGATRGIGSQLADDFESLGARLLLTGTHRDEVERLNEAHPPRRTYYCVDFTIPEELDAFLEEIRGQDRIDVCVNNAGINQTGLLEETQLADWERMTAVNLKAPFLITQEVSRIMKQNGTGRIVNIASIFGVLSREKRAIYSMTKSGLHGLTVTSSIELARHNILVNSVSPGFVLTDLTRKNLSEAEMKELAGEIPARRLASPDEISRVVVFLASSLNTYLTGQNIIVDGGYVNV